MTAATSVREILVATDFSDDADRAVRVALDYARRFKARVHLVHVLSGLEVEVERPLADAAAIAGPDVQVRVANTRGDPAEEILRYARGHAIDLIVVGTHGRTGFSRAILGSVAERVVRGSVCPVLVIPSRALAGAPAVDAAEDADAAPTVRTCFVCARPSPDLICEACRARIRGEALERKQREERAGRT